MSAREDYPLLAWMEGSAPWPEGEKPTLAESVSGALSHIDALRTVAEAALAWRRCKHAVRSQSVEETQRHHDAVRFAERHLDKCLAELLGFDPGPLTAELSDAAGSGPMSAAKATTDVWGRSDERDHLMHRIRMQRWEINKLHDYRRRDRDELVGLRAENERLQAALTPAAMATAMQAAWNDWCSDTGSIPDGFSIAGPHTTRVYFNAKLSHFPDRVVTQLLAHTSDGR